MGLKETVSADIKAAMKARDKLRLETVRSIKKAILEKEVSIRPSGRDCLSELEELELLSQLAKQRRDSIAQYRSANRIDLAERETRELDILETYLPPALSESELEHEVDAIIADLGAASLKDMGSVMQTVMKKFKGQVDGSAVQQLVKAKLAK
ncbi:MAG: GatB/YqeY domain-containing protein [Cyanobacteria bacterium P01_E01_bin.34]